MKESVQQETFFELLPDIIKLKWIWLCRKKGYLDLDNPRTMSEKLQWIKIYGRDERMLVCADKYRVREYVVEKAGPEILNELYGVYERAEDIDFERLPDSFALKVNHHSGGNVLCRDKTKLDRQAAKKFLNKYMRRDNYSACVEWSYKNIPRRIVAEKYLEEDGKPPTDYKFSCFNGEPLYVSIHLDRFGDHHRNFYDLEWSLIPFTVGPPNAERPLMKPARLDEMAQIAKKLAADFPFVRVDLYCIEDQILFGEMTFFPNGGWLDFTPDSYDEYWGNKIHLPGKAP